MLNAIIHDSRSEIGLNQKNLEADTVRSRLEHLTIKFYISFSSSGILSLSDRSYFVLLLDVITVASKRFFRN